MTLIAATDSRSTSQADADIIVVGGGGSGLTTAIFAKKADASVILLEKHTEVRGSTGLSIGSVTATGTRLQKKAGIVDDPQAHFEDMPKFAPELAKDDNEALRRILVENVSESVAWLESLGVTFYGPMPEPPHRQPRMHNILPNSRAYIYFLEREARRVGVTIRVNSEVKDLLVEDGRVVGVQLRSGILRARKAVVLASGDYSSSPEWKERFNPPVRDIDGVNTTNTGDGQRMGEALGAKIKYGHVVYGPNLRFMPPPKPNLLQKLPPWPWFTRLMRWSLNTMPSWILRPFILSFVTTYLSPEPTMFREGAILVNRDGERFADELAKPNFAFGQQPQKQAFIVFDDEVAKKFNAWPYFISTAPGVAYAYLSDYKRTRPDLYSSAPTLGELARKIGVPSGTLEAEVAKHAAEAGIEGRPRVSKGPFHALGPVKSWIILTDGGLTVNTNHQVIRGDGTVVPGLYAVGSAGQGGLLLEGHGHHLAWAFTSGRLAARHAASA
ncbi:fumarate reductase flavoprotein subunit [Rhizobium petrolearium]|uniref:FAD-dependent oxidoreductase n=2 Tax=Neorhizobium TaxID=1525371 RepID=A0ABV0MDC3_9HYPH|nr:FAD-dependent oxidoreductase [Neorhizobium petrolearium]MBP1848422.1 fumarate reductase flavoprotein subunit [Neorhizobium petrolearium]MCC2614481.1 FAD-dependent oxidoreductase [Neorhizobium petrolearium]WGI72243.1 FAD-dependent oxidoreductase [Neorhizobium petrolearium]